MLSTNLNLILSSATAALFFGSTIASADPLILFESGAPEWVGPGINGIDYLGHSLARNQFIGFRFEVTMPVITSTLGANVFTAPGFSDDTAFLSLVRLTGPADMPDS